jgi:hypothetical protein
MLELHLLLNVYRSSIITKYDSRQRRAWGNPYIFYYFLGNQTVITGDAIKEAWEQGFARKVTSSYWAMHAWYDRVWGFLKALPDTLSQMGAPSSNQEAQVLGADPGKTPSMVVNAQYTDDTGTGDTAPRPDAGRICQLAPEACRQ